MASSSTHQVQPPSSSSSMETRFKALVEIRDMASNWDIDISEHLQRYMEEMLRSGSDYLPFDPSGSQSEQDGAGGGGSGGFSQMMSQDMMLSQGTALDRIFNKPNVNFAEAALLIQGSTSVYSKKVEYLYQLVMRSAENNRPAAQQMAKSTSYDVSKYMRASRNSRAIFKAGVDEEKILFGSDPSYLLLDDQLVESNDEDICLKEDLDSAQRRRLSMRGSARHSSIGDVSRSAAAMLQSVLQDESSGGIRLKISTCAINQSGTLLLSGLHTNTTGHDDTQHFPQMMYMNNNNNNNSNSGDNGLEETNYAANELFYDDGNDNDEMDMNFANGYDGPNPGDEFSLPNNRPFTPRVSLGTAAEGHARSVDQGGDEDESDGDLEPMVNPRLLLLDPHDASKDSKALQKRKCFQIPKILQQQNGKKETSAHGGGKDSIDLFDSVEVWKDLNTEKANVPRLDLYSLLLRKSRTVPGSGFHPSVEALAKRRYKSTLKGGSLNIKTTNSMKNKTKVSSEDVADEDFLYVDAMDDEVKFREQDNAAEQQDNSSAAVAPLSSSINTNLFAGTEGDGCTADMNSQRVAEMGENWTDDCGFDAQDDYGDGNDDFYIGPTDFKISNANAALSEEDELHRRLERVLNESLYLDKQGKSKLDSLEFADSYESLCRRHYDNFVRGAEQYAKETQLSKRVNEWTGRLETILAEQDATRAFDIYEYSTEVLQEAKTIIENSSASSTGSMERDDDEIGGEESDDEGNAGGKRSLLTFDDIADGKKQSDVCRYFLSCLQLANFGNIELVNNCNSREYMDQTGGPGNFDGTFQFKLISTDRTRLVM